MPTWISLLRAINLGSRNQVSMPALRAALAEAGFDDVRTHLQSGNVVARSAHRSPAAVADKMQTLLRTGFGVVVPVVVRTPEQLRQVVAGNPFPAAAEQRPKMLHVSFLGAVPDPSAVAALHSDAATEHTCRVEGDHLYVDYGEGVHGSRLTAAYLERRLGVPGTARNWRTVLALAELVADEPRRRRG